VASAAGTLGAMTRGRGEAVSVPLAGVPVAELLLSPLLDEDVLLPGVLPLPLLPGWVALALPLSLDVLPPLPADELVPSPPPPPQACSRKSADAERARSVLFMEVARIEKMDKQNTPPRRGIPKHKRRIRLRSGFTSFFVIDDIPG